METGKGSGRKIRKWKAERKGERRRGRGRRREREKEWEGKRKIA